ncbi:DUF3696 domain-containing protein [Dehalococcoides mccartyi]|uniref:DUF3696 domain-containing protein n=1 Tax=Dehalococcoides TaxID=61434 RepID=UPI0032424D0C
MLSRLVLKNYRAFKEIDIPLTKINIFLGTNNSGKSSILSSLNLLSQTLESSDRNACLLLNGKNEELGTYLETVHLRDIQSEIDIKLEFDVDAEEELNKYVYEDDKGINKLEFDIRFHYRKQRRAIVVSKIGYKTTHINNEESTFKMRISSKYSKYIIEKVTMLGKDMTIVNSKTAIVDLHHFIPTIIPSRLFNKRKNKNSKYYREIFMYLLSCQSIILDSLSHLHFIGPFRIAPERTYSYSGESPSSVGVHGEKSVDILVSDNSKRGRLTNNLRTKIAKWLKNAGIADDLEIKPLSDRHYEILVKNAFSKEFSNIADVGYGVSQVLPILVAGYQLPKHSILSIAEPEIHLHPKAQAELGSFLFDVQKRGVQLFVETHSEYLLLRLQQFVARGELKPEDVNVFYTYFDQTTKTKEIKRIPLGENGYYTSEWPEGFFPQKLEEARKLAKISNEIANG